MIVEQNLSQIKEKADEFAKDLYLSLLRDGKSIYVNTWGMSMYPFIKNGDRVKIEPINKEEIKIGDIVAVDIKNREGPWFFIHRVIKIAGRDGNKIYFTKGDAHKKGFNPVTIELIAGKITEIVRNNLTIQLKLPLWRRLNKIIAKLSFRCPKILQIFSSYISLIIEWKWFLFKVENRLKKVNPILYNSDELLLTCARKDLNQQLSEKAITLIKEGLHWEHFIVSSMKGQVTVLVYNALRTVAPYVHIPQYVYDRLESGYLYTVARTTSQHRELIGILGLFAKEKIPTLPLKGTFLADRLYGDISARGLNVDLDLLIREKDKDAARNILEKIGYQYGKSEDVKMWQWYWVFAKHKATAIELHWDITMMCRSIDRLIGLWEGTRYIKKYDIEYYELKEEELLLFLSCHLASSGGFGQLRYVCDINELLHKYKDILDWNSLMEKAKSWKLSNSLYFALKLSKGLFSSDVPLEVLRKLKPNFLKLILIKTFTDKKVILRNGFRRRLIDSFLSYIFFELIEAHSAKEYLAVFKRVFFPPQEAIGHRNYILRIFKGVSKLF